LHDGQEIHDEILRIPGKIYSRKKRKAADVVLPENGMIMNVIVLYDDTFNTRFGSDSITR
jgi:hypothetical protein